MASNLCKKLLNDPRNAVVDMLHGLVETSPQLGWLDGLPDIKVVFNLENNKQTVAVVSGGGSGHEPAHAGYVGSGMLSAAVCGDIFASPSAEAVLSAIRATAGPAGCLLIVKNYTGDRLHFGRAAEAAAAEGVAVQMVVVGEDCAIDEPGLAGRRGLAGTVFVHKVAGAAAAEGLPLPEVATLAELVMTNMGTLGVALEGCSLPGHPPSDRLGPNEMEIGLGIHGEPGAIKTSVMSADDAVAAMLERISHPGGRLPLPLGSQVVMMVNNLGGSSALELQVVTHSALKVLREKYQVEVMRVWCGSFMTSLNMAGVSLTLLRVDGPQRAPLLRYLDAPTSAPGWPHQPPYRPKPKTPTLVPLHKYEQEDEAAGTGEQGDDMTEVLRAALHAVALSLEQAAPLLDELDAKVGDGDCGSTLCRAAQALTAALTHQPCQLSLSRPWRALTEVAGLVGHTVGGTSGALYDLALTAAGRHLKGCDSASSASSWVGCLAAAVAAIERYGGAKPGCRTMLDALCPALQAAQHAVAQGMTALQCAAAAAEAAATGAQATTCMLAAAGRASYVPAAVLRDVPDPGAKAVAVWMAALHKSLAGEE